MRKCGKIVKSMFSIAFTKMLPNTKKKKFEAFFRNATKHLNIFRQIKHNLNKLFLFFTMYSSFTYFSRNLPELLGLLEFMGQL